MKALKPLQYQAARLLAEGRSVSAAASELRIHRSTIHLWLKRPDFSARIEDETRQAMAAMRGQTQRHLQETLQRTALAAQSARREPARKKIKARESEQIRAGLSKSVELPLETTQAPNVPPSRSSPAQNRTLFQNTRQKRTFADTLSKNLKPF